MFPSALRLVQALRTNGERCAAVLPPTASFLVNPGRSNVFVDASSSWGIGIYTDGLWDAWRYRPNHSFTSGDINGLEALAVEIGVHTIQVRGAQAKIFSDNTGVVHAFNVKKSRNPVIDSSVKRTYSLLEEKDMTVEFIYVPSKENPADAYSRGKLTLTEKRVKQPLNLPRELSSLLLRAVS